MCLLLGVGLFRVSAQTDVYRWDGVTGLFPVSCDGINVEWIECTGTLHWLSHYDKDPLTGEPRWAWVRAQVIWTGTSMLTGETFKGVENDPGIEIYDPETGYYIKEEGTIHGILIGNMGSHLNITFSYTYDQKGNWTFTFVEAKCH